MNEIINSCLSYRQDLKILTNFRFSRSVGRQVLMDTAPGGGGVDRLQKQDECDGSLVCVARCACATQLCSPQCYCIKYTLIVPVTV